jgi:hypothetical protein
MYFAIYYYHHHHHHHHNDKKNENEMDSGYNIRAEIKYHWTT